MDSAAPYLTVEALTGILFPLLYGLAAMIVYRYLMPACLPGCQGLASAMLAAQALVISKAVYIGPFSAWEEYQWNLHQEWNAPAMLASTQLALVGGVALLCAWHYKPRVAFGSRWSLCWVSILLCRRQPVGRDARLPTRLWYSGLMDGETWLVPLPADLAPGRYNVFTGIYRARDLERVPASDVNGAPFIDARVPLGALIIQS